MEKTSKQVKEVQTTQTLARTHKQTHKLTEEDKKDILLYYYLDNTRSTLKELLQRYNISEQYYYRLVKNKNNLKLIEEDITERRKLFSKKSELMIDKILNKVNSKIDNEDASIKDLITSLGILYDKTRLENNLSTSNNSISINIKVEK
ncbi:MAG: hypothetical protein IJI98_11200 [Methanosphaera sp.]|nr:hypothetical protein [Methanobrevibacter sp.]MBQ6754196.1 hypothetical protein [Bacteroidales bacterium]MBR0351362.1 hypothetical protein [Clostridia bacterium]MBR0473246.1 hypothetical protein [Methanosphaera sp.]